MTVSRVFMICNAYESGYGHGLNFDDKNEEYSTDTDLNEAYGIGYEEGSKRAHEDDLEMLKRIDKYLEDHPESVVEHGLELKGEISDLVDGVNIEKDGE